jgi:AGCS family alanine or glycine:cation symporter
MIYIEKVLWAATTVILLTTGLYFTFKLNFVQFKIKDMLKSFKKSNDYNGISPFESLSMTLGARIGVGNLAGIALAIYYGGPGAIFWIWVSTIICSSNAFSESVLGVMYRKKDNNEYVGGPSYYIEYGIKKRMLGKIYAIALIFAYIIGFLTVQSNTIVKSINEIYDYNPINIALIISGLTIVIIIKGLKRIANFSSKLVPIMTIWYILTCLYIIIININEMPQVIFLIVKGAFNPKSMTLGFITPLIIGFQRGIFSNEAGLGTGAIASATTNTDSPTKQGFLQVFGIYIETLVLSSMTAFIIILSNYNMTSWNNINGIEITQAAFTYHLGGIGNYVVMLAIFLFAFSTIITGYYYGESNLKFLFNRINKKSLLLFKIAVVVILLIGGIASPKIIWLIADIFVVILGIINAYALFFLRREVINEYKYYKHHKR